MGFLGNIIEKRSETSGVADPKQWFIDFINGGTKSKAGSLVSEDTAMQVMAVFAAVRLLAETEASVPFVMYQKTKAGKEKAENMPLYSVLHDISNLEQTAMEFRQMTMINTLLCGEAFAEIVRDPITFEIIELWPIPNRNVEVHYYESTNRLAFYRITLPKGGHKDLYPESIWHWKWISRNTMSVCKPVRLAREAMGLSLAAEEFGERFFSNGTNIGGIVEYEKTMSDNSYERYKKDIREGYEGLGKSNRLLFLEMGAKFIPVNTPPEAAQFIETRRFQIEEIARFYNIPPHMLMELMRSTNNNIENQSIGFVVYSLRPWCVRIEQSAFKDLLLPKQRKKYFFKHNVDALLRGDYESRMKGYAIGRQNGWMSANDIRELEDQNPIPKEQGGDEYLVNGNMITAANAAKQKGGKGNGKTGGNEDGV
jgi:HK97 family phage portal protein